MERSSQVLKNENPKSWIFFKKVRNLILSVPREKKSPWLRQYQSYISNWYINGKVFTSTTALNLKKLKKNQSWQNRILSLPRVSVPREKKSPWLRQYQSYISNWYINGNVLKSTTALVFTSTTALKPKKLNFFKKVRNLLNWILSLPREKKSPRLRQYQSYINNWFINGKVFTSTTTWKPKNWFFVKTFEIEFWLVTKSWNHSSRSQHEPIWRHWGCIVVQKKVDI